MLPPQGDRPLPPPGPRNHSVLYNLVILRMLRNQTPRVAFGDWLRSLVVPPSSLSPVSVALGFLLLGILASFYNPLYFYKVHMVVSRIPDFSSLNLSSLFFFDRST